MNKDEAIACLNKALTIRNLSNHTITMYDMYLRHFLDHCNKEDVSNLELKDAQDYCLMMIDRGDAPSSINTCMCALRYFYEAVLSKTYTRKQFPNLKFSESVPHLFSNEQILELLNTDDTRIKLIVLLGLDCGFRASETAHIRIGDVDVKKMIITIPDSKRNKTRRVKLSNSVLMALRNYYKVYGDGPNWSSDDYLFKSSHDLSKSVTVTTIHMWFKNYLKTKSFYSKDISYHDLRHSFATKMLEMGVDIFLLKKLLGHSSLASTSRYIHYTTKDIETTFSLSEKLGF